MPRVLSALVLLPVIIGIVGFLPPIATVLLAFAVVVLCVLEYFPLVERQQRLPRAVVLVAVTCAYLAVAVGPAGGIEVPLLASMIVLGSVVVATGRPDEDVARRLSVTVLPMIYVGLPLGAIVSVRVLWGAGAVFALLFTVMASDIAQYYGGRSMGRRPLAPVVSPKKTVEGAATGLVAGTVALPLLGMLWLPAQPWWALALLGATLVVLGIAGDLLESLLKRSAGVKDASALIPGHGGILDRVDSLLFAGPVYYMFLRYAGGW